MREIGHFIGGKHVAGTSGKFGDVFNPAIGEPRTSVTVTYTLTSLTSTLSVVSAPVCD